MNKKTLKILSLILSVIMILGLATTAFAASDDLNDGAYASVITASDFQYSHLQAYERYERILTTIKEDGVETPHSMLVGGDYTRILGDIATPGIAEIKNIYTSIYPEADENNVVCIQGNHDTAVSGFTKTGYYDMGVYNLYVINEDDFPWNQYLRTNTTVKKTASNLESTLNSLIAEGDMRPVIIMSHVPLHHSSRSDGGDNKYASYVFDVINEAAKTLDIAFLFGHNHSDDYDDYIGGSVNFLAPGEEIRIPDYNNVSEDTYLTETLNFTYADYGYVGYSGNSVTMTSTNVLTVGVIRFTENSIRFLKYTENGLYKADSVARKNPGTAYAEAEGTTLENSNLWGLIRDIFLKIPELIKIYFAIFIY